MAINSSPAVMATAPASRAAIPDALALLDAYEDDPELVLPVPDPGRLVISLSTPSLVASDLNLDVDGDITSPFDVEHGRGHAADCAEQSPTQIIKPTERETCRFKRARRRRKDELECCRRQAHELEHKLLTLKAQQQQQLQQQQQQPRFHSTDPASLAAQPTAPSAWKAVAKRQKRLRLQAEALNGHLRAMAVEKFRQTQHLERLLLRQPADKSLLAPKSKRPFEGHTRDALTNAVVLHNLYMHLDLFQGQIDGIVGGFSVARTSSTAVASMAAALEDEDSNGAVYHNVKIQERAHCGFSIGGMFCRVLPYSIAATGASMWQVLAFEDGGAFNIAQTPLMDAPKSDNMATQMYFVDVQSGPCSGSHMTFVLMRQRVTRDAVTITWVTSAAGLDTTHQQSTRTQGFILVTPGHAQSTTECVVQSYYEIMKDDCDDTTACDGRLFPGLTRKEALAYVAQSVGNKIKACVQAVEDVMMGLVQPSLPVH